MVLLLLYSYTLHEPVGVCGYVLHCLLTFFLLCCFHMYQLQPSSLTNTTSFSQHQANHSVECAYYHVGYEARSCFGLR